MTQTPTKLAVTCRKCDKGWNGYKTAHCATCHHTFTGITGFDKHRFAGKCLNPETMVHGSKHARAGERVFQDAGRAYPCWAFTETNDRFGGDDDDDMVDG